MHPFVSGLILGGLFVPVCILVSSLTFGKIEPEDKSSQDTFIDFDRGDATKIALTKRNYEINRCYKERGIPAMGFGYSVICLDTPVVLWVHEPETSP